MILTKRNLKYPNLLKMKSINKWSYLNRFYMIRKSMSYGNIVKDELRKGEVTANGKKTAIMQNWKFDKWKIDL
jgi:hypothetical protein